jgi:hypothetical protein
MFDSVTSYRTNILCRAIDWVTPLDEVLSTVTTKIIFWDMIPCILVEFIAISEGRTASSFRVEKEVK